MTRKGSSSKDGSVRSGELGSVSDSERASKIMNCIVNVSVILMSTMMGAFSQVMAGATEALASGMADAFGGESAKEVSGEEIKRKKSEVDEKMRSMISDVRKDIYAQLDEKRKEFEPLLSDPVFDAGPKIVEKYDFNLPKLYQELDDDSLLRYSKMLVEEDGCFSQMFKELTEWLNSLPKPATRRQNC